MKAQMMCLIGLQVPRAETFSIFALNAQGPGGRSAERLRGRGSGEEEGMTKVWKTELMEITGQYE